MALPAPEDIIAELQTDLARMEKLVVIYSEKNSELNVRLKQLEEQRNFQLDRKLHYAHALQEAETLITAIYKTTGDGIGMQGLFGSLINYLREIDRLIIEYQKKRATEAAQDRKKYEG